MNSNIFKTGCVVKHTRSSPEPLSVDRLFYEDEEIVLSRPIVFNRSDPDNNYRFLCIDQLILTGSTIGTGTAEFLGNYNTLTANLVLWVRFTSEDLVLRDFGYQVS